VIVGNGDTAAEKSEVPDEVTKDKAEAQIKRSKDRKQN
jgi:hypothetical protein